MLLGLAIVGPVAAEEEPTYDCLIEPSRVVEVGSAAVGVLEEVRVEHGDRVEAGQVLAVLESGVEAATVELAQLRASIDSEVLVRRATFELQQRNETRTERLHATNAIAQQAREEVQHDARVSALRVRQAQEERRLASLELARARQVLARRLIRSPIAGAVVERYKSPGERVEEQAIVQVAQLDPLRVQVVLPVEQYGSVVQGMAARVMPEHGTTGEYSARVTSIDPVLDAASGTFGVRLAMPNPDHQVPGGLRCTLSFIPGSAEQPEPQPEPEAPSAARTVPEQAPRAQPLAPTTDHGPLRPVSDTTPSAPEPEPVRLAAGQAASGSCAQLGPLETEQQARRLRRQLGAHGISARLEQRPHRILRGYLAVIDATGLDGGTKAVVGRLQRSGVHDYQVLPAMPGFVSVGYFNGPISAQARADGMKALDLPGRVLPRTRDEVRPVLMLDLGDIDDPAALVQELLETAEVQGARLSACPGIVTAQR